AGFHHPPRRITVNLAPAELRKAGASLDLAIAVGILLGSEQLRAGETRLGLIGELGLGGEIRRVPGLLPMAMALATHGVHRVVVPAEAVAEAALAPGVQAIGVATVAEAADIVRAPRSRRARPMPLPRSDVAGSDAAGATSALRPTGEPVVDLADVRG